MSGWIRIADRTEELKAKIEGLYPEGILRETAMAYADSVVVEQGWFDEFEEEAYALRSTDWAGQYTDAQTFLKQAEIVGEYNNFKPSVAKLIADYSGDQEYRLARENSVAVYLKPGWNITPVQKNGFNADEANLNSGELRLWWD